MGHKDAFEGMPGDYASGHSVYDAAGGPKELVEIDGGHFGLLHFPSSWFDVASAVQRAFLLRAPT